MYAKLVLVHVLIVQIVQIVLLVIRLIIYQITDA